MAAILVGGNARLFINGHLIGGIIGSDLFEVEPYPTSPFLRLPDFQNLDPILFTCTMTPRHLYMLKKLLKRRKAKGRRVMKIQRMKQAKLTMPMATSCRG
jgi:hypothetical protein